MDSQKFAGLLAGVIGLVVLAVAFYSTSKWNAEKQAAPVQQVDAPQVPAPAPTRGPVVQEIPQ